MSKPKYSRQLIHSYKVLPPERQQDFLTVVALYSSWYYEFLQVSHTITSHPLHTSILSSDRQTVSLLTKAVLLRLLDPMHEHKIKSNHPGPFF